MKGLAPHTGLIFDAISNMECIKPYVLVGGTALSIQLGTRQSEDLDFMRWRSTRDEQMEVSWRQIEKELLATFGNIESMDILDIDHVEYIVKGVKLSFYACDKYSPVNQKIHVQGNLYLADPLSIGAMKMEVSLRRSNFRDYYDIYSLLQSGISFREMTELALDYSQHRLKSKNLLALLTNGSRFKVDSSFALLQPIYNITPLEIEEYIRKIISG